VGIGRKQPKLVTLKYELEFQIAKLCAQIVMQERPSLVIFIFSLSNWVGQALCTNCHAKKTRKSGK